MITQKGFGSCTSTSFFFSLSVAINTANGQELAGEEKTTSCWFAKRVRIQKADGYHEKSAINITKRNGNLMRFKNQAPKHLNY